MTTRKNSHGEAPTISVAEVQRKAIAALQRYARVEEPYRKTQNLKEVAVWLVELRSMFLNDEGEPDWRGQTYDYRQAVTEIYGLANIPSDERESVSAAIRYHVGNELRDRLDESEITSIGLRAVSPKGRSNERRRRQSRILARVKGAERLDAVQLLASAAAIVDEIDPGSIQNATLRERKSIEKFMRRLRKDLDSLQGTVAAA